jgi:hypothetical protein
MYVSTCDVIFHSMVVNILAFIWEWICLLWEECTWWWFIKPKHVVLLSYYSFVVETVIVCVGVYLFTYLIIYFSFTYLFIYSVYLLYLTLLLNDEQY